MDFREARVKHRYVWYVVDADKPPRQLFQCGPMNYTRFNEFMDKAGELGITIIRMMTVYVYPYDVDDISEVSNINTNPVIKQL